MIANASQDKQDSSMGTTATVFTWIVVILAMAAISYCAYVVYTRKMMQRPFLARVHFQNPIHNFASDLPTTLAKVNQPEMCTNRRFNQIFMNAVYIDEVEAKCMLIVTFALTLFTSYSWAMQTHRATTIRTTTRPTLDTRAPTWRAVCCTPSDDEWRSTREWNVFLIAVYKSMCVYVIWI